MVGKRGELFPTKYLLTRTGGFLSSLFVKKTYGGWKESGERSPLAAQTELVLCKSVIEWDVEYLVTEVDCSRIQVGEG